MLLNMDFLGLQHASSGCLLAILFLHGMLMGVGVCSVRESDLARTVRVAPSLLDVTWSLSPSGREWAKLNRLWAGWGNCRDCYFLRVLFQGLRRYLQG